MSRPRKPFGPSPPGRLAATMVKVLAAEMSDSGRLARGKRYWAEGAVLDVTVGDGRLTAEIQGGRPEPYRVTIEAAEGHGVPSRYDVWVSCTCPDDGLYEACKHAVAALFALSDEIAIEPELVDRWRHGGRSARRQPNVSTASAPSPRSVAEAAPERDPQADLIARLVAAPPVARDALAGLADDVDTIEHPPLADPQLGALLVDALARLELDWE